jgi:hypothetical protein
MLVKKVIKKLLKTQGLSKLHAGRVKYCIVVIFYIYFSITKYREIRRNELTRSSDPQVQ